MTATVDPHAAIKDDTATFRTFMITRILAGYYNVFSRSKWLRAFAFLYSIVLSMVISKVVIELAASAYSATLIITAHWMFNVILSLLTGEKYFFQFCKAIKQIDVRMSKPCLLLNQPLSRIIWKIIICMNLAMLLLLTAVFIGGYIRYIVFLRCVGVGYIWAALNTTHVIHVYILEIAFSRIKVLRNSLQDSLRKPLQRGYHRITQKIKIIHKCIAIYKSILGSLNSTFFPMEILITVSQFSNFAKIVLYGGAAIDWVRIPHCRIVIGITVIENLLACIMACLPAMFAQQARHEANEMKIVIADQLLICEDKQLQNVIEDTFDFLTAHPIKMRICRFCSIDKPLPLASVILCSIYLIVLVKRDSI